MIEEVRSIVGPDLPIIGTLDLHAQVTQQMVHFADALVAWETYPHRDAFSTGQRAARLILDVCSGQANPTMAMASVPVITGGFHGSTDGEGPFAELMRYTKSLEAEQGVLSTSLFLGHPYLDMPEMGSGGLVVTDDNEQLAVHLARDVARKYWDRRFDLEPTVETPSEAVAKGLSIDGGPILLIEAADCCGGGAAGDGVATLRALLAAEIEETAIVPVVDAEAAQRCHQQGEEQQIRVPLGHQHDPRWGEPLEITGRVVRLSDGRFQYRGGIWDGVHGNMGPSAVLDVQGVQILVTTYATYDWGDEQYQSMNLDARHAKFVVVKNPMNYRNVYPQIAKAIFVLDTPGPTPVTIRNVRFERLQRPYFPVDEYIPGLKPRVIQ